MKTFRKIILFTLMLSLLAMLTDSCAKRKCDGNKRIKVPMGYM